MEELATRSDIIFAPGPEIALKSAVAATQTLPIVTIAIDYDVVAKGYVDSLARPGGNVTGTALLHLTLRSEGGPSGHVSACRYDGEIQPGTGQGYKFQQ